MIKVILQEDEIDIAETLQQAGTDADGALMIFIGRARNSTNNREVKYLEYQIYESMARKELEKIADYSANKWALNTCLIVHRYGKVGIGSASVIIVVSSPHRNASFESSRYIIDTIKKKAPIWKKEFYTDGSIWISEGS